MRFLFWMMCLTSSLSFAKSPHAGIFSSINGTVSIVRTQQTIKASLGDKIFQGDSIVTKENSSAKVLYRDNSMIEVKASTKFLIETVAVNEETKSVFSLIFGKIRALVGSREEDESYDIKAGGTVLGIRGTEFILAATQNVKGQTEMTNVSTFVGTVTVTKIDVITTTPTEIEAGQSVTINLDGSVTKTTFDPSTEGEKAEVLATSETALEPEQDSLVAVETVITTETNTTDGPLANQAVETIDGALEEVVVLNADSAQTLSTSTNLSLTINVTDLSVYDNQQ